jgi:hypothetical protein
MPPFRSITNPGLLFAGYLSVFSLFEKALIALAITKKFEAE